MIVHGKPCERHIRLFANPFKTPTLWPAGKIVHYKSHILCAFMSSWQFPTITYLRHSIKKNNMQLHNNKILITGGASGIGLGLTKRFIQENNTVIICGRREDVLKEVADQFPTVITKVCDL